MEHIEAIREHETALQRAITVWIITGLYFMLLPGTFLGSWNLIRISNLHSATNPDPSWLQAHGLAQIFGWIGSFILGIGFYSLQKMGGTARFAVRRAWTELLLNPTGNLRAPVFKNGRTQIVGQPMKRCFHTAVFEAGVLERQKMQKVRRWAISSGLLAGVATAVYFIARNRGQHSKESKPVELGNAVSPDLVEVASVDSFPASDAPSWIGAALR